MAQLSLHSLRGKQSVRVTFKLATETIDLLTVMASQLGIKQKTLFDHLIERQELRAHLSQNKTPHVQSQPKRQKTFVLSQETLQTLNILSEKHQAPRNLLVEMAVQRLLPILMEEQEKHGKRKIMLQHMAKEAKRHQHLLDQAQTLLSSDDPVCEQIREANEGLQRALKNTRAIIERGKGMESL